MIVEKPTVVKSWLGFYNEFMRNIVREERRKAGHNPLARSRSVDDSETVGALPGHDEAFAIYNRVLVLLDALHGNANARGVHVLVELDAPERRVIAAAASERERW